MCRLPYEVMGGPCHPMTVGWSPPYRITAAGLVGAPVAARPPGRFVARADPGGFPAQPARRPAASDLEAIDHRAQRSGKAVELLGNARRFRRGGFAVLAHV